MFILIYGFRLLINNSLPYTWCRDDSFDCSWGRSARYRKSSGAGRRVPMVAGAGPEYYRKSFRYLYSSPSVESIIVVVVSKVIRKASIDLTKA